MDKYTVPPFNEQESRNAELRNEVIGEGFFRAPRPAPVKYEETPRARARAKVYRNGGWIKGRGG